MFFCMRSRDRFPDRGDPLSRRTPHKPCQSLQNPRILVRTTFVSAGSCPATLTVSDESTIVSVCAPRTGGAVSEGCPDCLAKKPHERATGGETPGGALQKSVVEHILLGQIPKPQEIGAPQILDQGMIRRESPRGGLETAASQLEMVTETPVVPSPAQAGTSPAIGRAGSRGPSPPRRSGGRSFSPRRAGPPS